ncbi:allantoicase-like [Amphiura filiformis]|uniref:allantoicase-like n=1 Tax=Amphiura filiformis TaxID=82378 RepID=UPI003B20BF8C
MGELPHFVELNDLASERVGGKILFATDDWFAVAENLLKPENPVWKEEDFTEFGKWMDGWETRRKRIPGHDWCIIKLGIPGLVYGFDVNTAFFTGNYAPRVSIQAACLENDDGFPERTSEMGSAASEEQFEAMKKLNTEAWDEILPMREMGSGNPATCNNILEIPLRKRWTHIRLNMFPDGGIARLRVYGVASPDWANIPSNQLLDLVAMENGGVCVGYSNVHYGHARNLLTKPRSKVMKDGWETARRLDRPAILTADENCVLQVDGSEWCVFRLGHHGTIKEVEIDTNHFKGNFPDSCTVEGAMVVAPKNKRKVSVARMGPIQQGFTGLNWRIILPQTKLSAHKQHFFKGAEVQDIGAISHVRLTMRPDGGVSRMRLWGYKQGTPSIPEEKSKAPKASIPEERSKEKAETQAEP